MRIADVFRTSGPVFSFEFFPPKTDQAAEELRATIAALAPLQPDYVSVTYGAGGSTRERTIELVTEIKKDTGIEAMAHLTCVGHTAEELAQILDRLDAAGIENVLALRGDPPRGQATFRPTEGGFAHSSDLAAFIRSRWSFCLGGACYPEGHLESPDLEHDLANTKRKVDAGIEFLNTQLFFEAEDYLRYVRRARDLGIGVPIVPGILPVTTAAQLSPKGFITRCGATVPDALRDLVARAGDDEDAVTAVGIEWTTVQCLALLRAGAPGIHFYTLNRSRSALEVFKRLTAEIPSLARA
ncbi:MAG TPA: methylenetetrahydrofolate reductase [NAD(P)H] [Candidatus Limnocylindria bacterium]|nr:methylenetetrahydrofolate reductase [NAD(P)H] [Candidatus Limnocylindria bacterium]